MKKVKENLNLQLNMSIPKKNCKFVLKPVNFLGDDQRIIERRQKFK